MINESLLLWGILFSSIGLGFFIYGKKQQRFIPLICGFSLMIYPYFVETLPLFIGIGVMLTLIPYFIRR